MPTLPTFRVASWLSRAADAAVATLYPQGCHVCGGVVLQRAGGVACEQCWADPAVTPLWAGAPVCPRCGLPSAAECPDCALSGVDAARSAGAYTGALRACLLDLKRRENVCRNLRLALDRSIASDGVLLGADLVVPVPLHPRRRAERGFNQAELLSRAVTAISGAAHAPHALARVRPAPRQRAGLDRRGRIEAVEGVFRAARGVVDGAAVLLVDDVFTTGATLAACAGALRDAGARRVVALTAARAIGRVA